MTGEQPINVNEKEIELIRRTFKGNEELMKSIRALFFGLGVTHEEKELIRSTFASEELRAIMWRRFCPQLSKDTPIGQVQDAWLGAEQMVFGQPRDTIEQAISYKARAIDMTKAALALLENPDGAAPNVTYDPWIVAQDPLQIGLLARNQYLRHVEQQLLFLKLLAEQEPKTPAAINKRSAR